MTLTVDLDTIEEDEVDIIEGGVVAYWLFRVEPCPHCGCDWFVDPGSTLASGYLCGYWHQSEYPCIRSEADRVEVTHE